MVAEVALVLEASLAFGAVGVHVTVVALEVRVAVEYLWVLTRQLRHHVREVRKGGVICVAKSVTDLFTFLTGMVLLLCMIP